MKKKNQSPSECNKLSFRGLWEIKGLVLNSSRERKEGEGRIPGEDDTRTMTDKKQVFMHKNEVTGRE